MHGVIGRVRLLSPRSALGNLPRGRAGDHISAVESVRRLDPNLGWLNLGRRLLQLSLLHQRRYVTAHGGSRRAGGLGAWLYPSRAPAGERVASASTSGRRRLPSSRRSRRAKSLSRPPRFGDHSADNRIYLVVHRSGEPTASSAVVQNSALVCRQPIRVAPVILQRGWHATRTRSLRLVGRRHGAVPWPAETAASIRLSRRPPALQTQGRSKSPARSRQ